MPVRIRFARHNFVSLNIKWLHILLVLIVEGSRELIWRDKLSPGIDLELGLCCRINLRHQQTFTGHNRMVKYQALARVHFLLRAGHVFVIVEEVL